MRRWLALVVVVAVVGIGAFAATAWIAGDDQETTTPTVTAPPPLARLRIIFPEGFTIREMADRVAAVRGIAIAKRGVTPSRVLAESIGDELRVLIELAGLEDDAVGQIARETSGAWLVRSITTERIESRVRVVGASSAASS